MNALDYYYRGTAYYRKGNYELAIQNFDQAILLNDKFTSAHLWRGTAYYQIGDYDLAKEDFKGFLPDHIAHYYLHKEFFEAVINEKLWPENPFFKNDITNLYIVKKQIATSILNLKDPELRQIALWQALISKTFLGSIFNIARGMRTPSLSSSENKQNIARALLGILETTENHEFKLDEATKQALQQDESLQKDLRKNFPVLYNKLVAEKILEISSPLQDLSFFTRADDGVNVCTTVATPEGQKPNPEYNPGIHPLIP